VRQHDTYGFDLAMVKLLEADLRKINTPPYFTEYESQPLPGVNITSCGEDWEYALPESTDSQGHQVLFSMITESSLYGLVLDDVTESLRVPKKTFTWRNNGSHVAVIYLKDKYSAMSSYFQEVKVQCELPPASFWVMGVLWTDFKGDQLPAPTALLHKISKRGIMEIEFSQEMKQVRDSEELEEGKVLIDGVVKDAVEIRVAPGEDSQPEFLNLTWKMVSFKGKYLIINVTFENA